MREDEPGQARLESDDRMAGQIQAQRIALACEANASLHSGSSAVRTRTGAGARSSVASPNRSLRLVRCGSGRGRRALMPTCSRLHQSRVLARRLDLQKATPRERAGGSLDGLGPTARRSACLPARMQLGDRTPRRTRRAVTICSGSRRRAGSRAGSRANGGASRMERAFASQASAIRWACI